MADQEVHPGSFVGDTIEEFKRLPTWGKIAVGVGALAVVGIAIYLRNRANGSSSGATSGISAGGSSSAGLPVGSADLSGSTASGPTSGSSSGTTPVPGDVQNGFVNNVFQKLTSGTDKNGLLGHGATVYSAGGQVYATQPGGISALLSSILPSGTKVFQGGNGRWWYQLPGEKTQYLLTSGAGNAVSGNSIGQVVKTPSNALTIGQTTSATMATNHLPVTHS